MSHLSIAHICIHDKQNLSLSYMETPSHNHFQQVSQDYQNIRIHFDFTNWFLGPDSLKTHLQTMIIPPVQNLLQAALKVRPNSRNLIPPKDLCGGILYLSNETLFNGYDADLVLFVSTSYNQYESFIASASACTLSLTDNRPLFGIIEFNTYYFTESANDADIESNIYVTLHEITHALGFSSGLYSYFIDPLTLKPLTNILTNKTVNGATVQVLNLPPLTARLRTHFNCPTLEGAYLENQGSIGSAGSHFERRLFYNEYMTASRIKDSRFTEFTLALLEGTGWYQVDYKYAEPITWGKNEGCDFLDTTCVNLQTKQAAFKEFCSPLTSAGITWTKRGYGVCGNSKVANSSGVSTGLDYWGNLTVLSDQFADNCPKIEYYSNRDCEDINSQASALLKNYEFYGYGAKAFAGTLYPQTTVIDEYGFCFKTQCIAQTGGGYELKVLFGSSYAVTCTSEGKVDPPSETGLKGKLNCPDPTSFCNQIMSEGYCKGSCFGAGTCVNRECVCNDGWTSYSCAKKQYVDNCARCANENVNKTSCYGNDCVCNPSNKTCKATIEIINDDNTNNSSGQSYSTMKIVGTVAGLVVVVCLLIFGGKFVNKMRKPKQDGGIDLQNLAKNEA